MRSTVCILTGRHVSGLVAILPWRESGSSHDFPRVQVGLGDSRNEKTTARDLIG